MKWLATIVAGPVARHIVTALVGALIGAVIVDPAAADACRAGVLHALFGL